MDIDFYREELIRMVAKEGLSIKKIAIGVGVNQATMKSFLAQKKTPSFVLMCKLKCYFDDMDFNRISKDSE